MDSGIGYQALFPKTVRLTEQQQKGRSTDRPVISEQSTIESIDVMKLVFIRTYGFLNYEPKDKDSILQSSPLTSHRSDLKNWKMEIPQFGRGWKDDSLQVRHVCALFWIDRRGTGMGLRGPWLGENGCALVIHSPTREWMIIAASATD